MMSSTSMTYQAHPPMIHLGSQQRPNDLLKKKLRQQVLMMRGMKKMVRTTWGLQPAAGRAFRVAGGQCRDLALLGPLQMPLWVMTCVKGMPYGPSSLLDCCVLHQYKWMVWLDYWRLQKVTLLEVQLLVDCTAAAVLPLFHCHV